MKNIIKVLLVVMALVLVITAFTACEPEQPEVPEVPENPTPEVCKHENVEFVMGKEPTCTEDGLTSGFKCKDCGEWTVAQEVDPAGHDYTVDVEVDATCTEPGYTEKKCARCDATTDHKVVEALGHDIVVDAAVDATCTATGLTAGEHCSRCDHKVEQTVVAALGHNIVADAAVAPTCTETGLTAGEHCSRCDYKVAQTVLEALGHKEETLAGKDPTCTETGLTEGKKCSVCGTVTVAQKEIPAGHNVGENGVCTGCGYVIVDTLEELTAAIKVVGNKIIVLEGTYAIGSGENNTFGVASSVELVGQGEVVLEGTLAGTVDNVKIKDLTIKNGNAQRWAYAKGDCVFENVTFNATSVYAIHFDGVTEGATLLYKDCTIIGWAAMSGSPASCVFDGCTINGNGTYGVIRTYFDATIKNCTFDVADVNPDDVYQDGIHAVDATITVENCTNVNGEMKDIIDTSKKGYIVLDGETIHIHKYQEETVAPTCTEAGHTTYTCPCGYTYTEEKAATGHDYQTAYEWSDDNSTCTAKDVCQNDADHVVVKETATVKTVTLNVTATNVTYTYRVEFAGEFEAQEKVLEGGVTVENGIATINAPAIAGRVASHDYVKFGFHDATATHTFTIYYSEVDVWDGTSVSTSLVGSGTAEDPYLIQSGADLAYLKSVIDATAGEKGANYKVKNFEGKYFKMTKSIDLNGASFMIGYHKGWNEYEAFCGIFDGNNCTIRGINMTPANSGSTGLFACISNGGALKNLSLYGKVTGVGTVGSAVAYLVHANSTVDNVTNYATITATGGTIGGIVGNQESSSGALTNCVNYGNVTSTSYIVGGVTGSGGATITNCVNWGNVQGGSEIIGGITGTTKNTGTISGCYNYGSVKTTATDKGMIGGIAGKCLKPVSDCHNFGTITGVNTTGGIVGSTDSTITNCTNHGEVNGSSWLIGGIAGSADANVSGCENYANITSTGDCVGGIVGSSKATVSGCENYGTIKGTGRSAGIAYYSTGTIENCVNNGEVIGGWDLGGILAWVGDGQSATITNCTNNGNITGTWNNGGIFGLAHENAGTVTITGCTNNGHIKSTTGGQISIAVKAVITECTENGSWTKAE